MSLFVTGRTEEEKKENARLTNKILHEKLVSFDTSKFIQKSLNLYVSDESESESDESDEYDKIDIKNLKQHLQELEQNEDLIISNPKYSYLYNLKLAYSPKPT